jgi:hydrogenase nickel incorporation protein HypA/HybF
MVRFYVQNIYGRAAGNPSILHELSIAQNIVDSILTEANDSSGKRVSMLDVEIGELMQLDRNALSYAIKLLMTGPLLSGARVRVHVKKVSFVCKKCGKKWGMAEAQKQLSSVPDSLRISEPDSKELPLHFLPYLYPAFIKCPECGSADITAIGGHEIRLKELTFEGGP